MLGKAETLHTINLKNFQTFIVYFCLFLAVLMNMCGFDKLLLFCLVDCDNIGTQFSVSLNGFMLVVYQ